MPAGGDFHTLELMGLLDWLRRSPPAPAAELRELWHEVGRLGAEVERMKGLELTWHDYHDRMNRLVMKLDKRDQRGSASSRSADPIEEGRQLFNKRFGILNGGDGA